MRRKAKKAAARKTFGPCQYDCGRQAVYKGSMTCDACYQALYYWLKKGVSAILDRQRQLGVFRRRMEAISNVRDISTARPTRKRA